jgi:hypothetical protein
MAPIDGIETRTCEVANIQISRPAHIHQGASGSPNIEHHKITTDTLATVDLWSGKPTIARL